MVIPQYFFVSVKLGCSRCARNAPCWREPLQLTGEAWWSSRWREARGSASSLHWYCLYRSERLFTVVLPGNLPAQPVKKLMNVEKKRERAFIIIVATATSAENSRSLSLSHTARQNTTVTFITIHNCGDFVWFNTIIRYCVK